jgi:hypothetical protein
MGIIVELGKIRIKEILTEAYFYAIEKTRMQKFGIDDQDTYPRPMVINFINYNDKLDWMILEEIASEIPWFYAEKKGMIFHFQTPEYHGRHDCEIFFQTHLTGKLSQYGLDCYNVTYSRD